VAVVGEELGVHSGHSGGELHGEDGLLGAGCDGRFGPLLPDLHGGLDNGDGLTRPGPEGRVAGHVGPGR